MVLHKSFESFLVAVHQNHLQQIHIVYVESNQRKHRGNKRERGERKKKKQNTRVVNELPLSVFETMEIPFLVLFIDNIFY